MAAQKFTMIKFDQLNTDTKTEMDSSRLPMSGNSEEADEEGFTQGL